MVVSERVIGSAVCVTLRPGGTLDRARGGQAFFANTTWGDIGNAIVVDVEVTTAIRQAKVLATKRMIECSVERFDLYLSQLLGDSGYGSAETVGWLVC